MIGGVRDGHDDFIRMGDNGKQQEDPFTASALDIHLIDESHDDIASNSSDSHTPVMDSEASFGVYLENVLPISPVAHKLPPNLTLQGHLTGDSLECFATYSPVKQSKFDYPLNSPIPTVAMDLNFQEAIENINEDKFKITEDDVPITDQLEIPMIKRIGTEISHPSRADTEEDELDCFGVSSYSIVSSNNKPNSPTNM